MTPEQVENDPDFESVLSASGHGIPSAPSQIGSHAIAALLNWWDKSDATKTDKLSDIICLEATIAALKEEVHNGKK